MALLRNPDGRRSVRRRRPRDREPRLALDQLPAGRRVHRARAHGARGRRDHAAHRPPARRAGTRDATARTRGACCSSTAASPTARTATPTTCPTTCRCARGSASRPLLIVPYTLDANDMRFATPQGFNSGEQFFAYLRDTFDTLYAEGDPRGLDAPKMMSVGLHCRLVGRPGRAAALARFLDYVRGAPRRLGRAPHRHRAPLARRASAAGGRRMTLAEVNAMDEAAFVAALGGVFEHSPWVAQGALAARPVRERGRAARGDESVVTGAERRAEARAAARAPRARRQGRDTRRADDGFDAGAIRRRTHRVLAGGIRDAHRAQPALQREVRLPVHPRGKGLRSRRRSSASSRAASNSIAPTELARMPGPDRAYHPLPPGCPDHRLRMPS